MKSRFAHSLVFAAVILSFFSVGQAEAQQNDHSFRATGAFTLGFAGRGELSGSSPWIPPWLLGGAANYDLDPTLGVHLAGAFQFGQYFLVGGEFNHWAWRADGADDREHILGLGVQLGVHYDIPVGQGFSIDPVFMLGAGYATFLNSGPERDEAIHGYFVGVRGGATFWFMPNFGATLLMGYEFMRAGDSEENWEYDVKAREVELRFGASVRF